ncbi:hypothetical protein ASPCAL01306 [Aspergillus calidoustus]|uniref:ATP-grasp domain-containing protein n=1 Tax=Aspergillus calidoustus TaxID=454130 RepID=A0A0U5FXD2_ASPCI|nr:hypothetical protein ASPCAL01306 [Aspergillus calidoustus]
MGQSGRVKACWDTVEAYYEFQWRASSATEWWQSVDVIVTLQAESESKTTIGEAQGSDAFDNIEESASLWYSTEPKSAVGAAPWTKLNTSEQGFSPRALALFQRALKATAGPMTTKTVANGGSAAIRFVFPTKPGYAVRSDIFSLRMVDLEIVDADSAVSFHPTEPEKLLRPLPVDLSLEDILHVICTNAVGGLLPRPLSSYNENITDYASIFQNLDIELTNRLSFPWLTHSPPPPRTLAIVEDGRSSPSHGGTATSIYTAARALNISMIVLDVAGHWLEGSEYAHWREHFIPIQLEPPSLLQDRILDALSRSGHQVDALVTFCDSYQVPVAQAAEQLGLLTASAEAFEIATDKYRTGLFEGRPAFLVRSVEEALDVVQRRDLEYPFIVKPCKGFLSEGVFKIHSPEELASAIGSVNLDRHGVEFVLEAYCDGPEVDINFVLSEGELLFCEVSDDFPKTADANYVSSEREEEDSRQQQQPLTSLVELGNVLPSNLPPVEIKILRESLHRSLVRLGLKTGIFHLEARVQNSSAEYGVISSSPSSSDTTANPITDLVPRSTPVNGKPSAWLIEINPRPPGIQETAAVESTYGIDYRGIGLLSALRDHARIRSLSHPFLQGPQYWSKMVFIPVTHGGVFNSDDVCAELIERRPDLGRHVSRSFCFLKRGDRFAGPEEGITGWVAYFVVFSKVSRAELLKLSREVRAEVRIRVV